MDLEINLVLAETGMEGESEMGIGQRRFPGAQLHFTISVFSIPISNIHPFTFPILFPNM